MLLSEGQMSDYKGAALMCWMPWPPAKTLLGDRGYDAGWFRNALRQTRHRPPRIPSKTNRKISIPHDRTLYHQRHKIENMFGRLKDWRRIHTRYDRCSHTFSLSHLYRSNRHLLDQTMSPEPRCLEFTKRCESILQWTVNKRSWWGTPLCAHTMIVIGWSIR